MLPRIHVCLSPIIILLLLLAAHDAAHADKHPAEVQGLKSIHSETATRIRITNNSGKPVKVHWLNFDGERELYATLKEGESFENVTFLTHPWLVTDEHDAPLGIYFPDGQARVVRIMPASEEGAAAPSQAAANSPELDVLSQFVKQFDTAMEVKYGGETFKSQGSSEGRWIHDGQFVRQTWSLEPSAATPAMNGSSIMAFDPSEKAYRRWSFISTGPVEESRGEWDAKTRTITWTADGNELGGKTITKSAFDDNGRETWSIRFQDADGRVATEVRGISTPRK
jgi:von Hippel-Lindau disease tumor supressor